MAINLLESFDGWSTVAQMTNLSVLNGNTCNKWLQRNLSSHDNWELVAGFTGNALRKKTSTSASYPAALMGTTTEVYLGFRYNPVSVTGEHRICTLLDDTATTALAHLARDGDKIQLETIATTGTLVKTDSIAGLLTAGSWHYIELYFKLSHTVGRFDARVNGVLVATFTGDTQRTTSTGTIQWFAPGSDGSAEVEEIGDMWDDMYIVDPLTAGQASYLGDTRIRCIRPNANGDDSDWAGSDGNSTDNYLLIDEQNVSDADYVQASLDGERDLYNFENPTITGEIRGAQLVARAADLAPADPKDVNFITKLAGVELATLRSLDNTMRERWKIWETKPGGGLWTPTDINDTQFGYEQVDA